MGALTHNGEVIDKLPGDASQINYRNETVESALDNKANKAMTADDFDAADNYSSGNYCIHDGKLYKFKNNHSGAWSAADVEEIQITGELSAIKSGLNNVLCHVALSIPANTYNTVGDALNALYNAFGQLSTLQKSRSIILMGSDVYSCYNVYNGYFTSCLLGYDDGWFLYRNLITLAHQSLFTEDKNGYITDIKTAAQAMELTLYY